jgi:hypothetical protein
MRHRAVLFGLLAAFLAYAAFHRHLHSLALIAAAVSVVAFLALAISVGNYNSALSTVVKADILALALLINDLRWRASLPVAPAGGHDEISTDFFGHGDIGPRRAGAGADAEH